MKIKTPLYEVELSNEDIQTLKNNYVQSEDYPTFADFLSSYPKKLIDKNIGEPAKKIYSKNRAMMFFLGLFTVIIAVLIMDYFLPAEYKWIIGVLICVGSVLLVLGLARLAVYILIFILTVLASALCLIIKTIELKSFQQG